MENVSPYVMMGDNELACKTQNSINEINAFMSHFMISRRVFDKLTIGANQIVEELERRMKNCTNESDVLVILEKMNELQQVSAKFKEKFEKFIVECNQPQPGNK